MKVTNSDLVARVSDRERIGRGDVKRILAAAAAEITAAIAAGDTVVVAGLGTFRASTGRRHGGIAFRKGSAAKGGGGGSAIDPDEASAT